MHLMKKKLGTDSRTATSAAAPATASTPTRKPSTPGGAAAASATAGSSDRSGKQGSSPKPGAGAGVRTAPEKPPVIEPLPAFKDVSAPERQQLFIKKLQLCAWPMDFADQSDVREKEIKRQSLLEIMDYINNTKNVFNEQTFPEIIQMIAQNLFRGLAPASQPAHAQYDPEEDEPVLEPAWPHLQYVYEFLLRFVVSNETDPKVVKKYVDTQFLVRLLDLFDSEAHCTPTLDTHTHTRHTHTDTPCTLHTHTVHTHAHTRTRADTMIRAGRCTG